MKNNEFVLGTLNVRSLMSEDRMIELENALNDSDIKILGLSEVRRRGEKIIERKNNYIFMYCNEESGSKGVGFLVHNDLKRNFQEFNAISSRITSIKLKFKNIYLTIFQIYAPTSVAEDEECEAFYEALLLEISKIKVNSTNLLIVMGDFNSQIGFREPEEENVMGPYG